MGDTLEAALQALITGMLFALVAGAIALAVHSDPFQAALIVGSLAGLLAWLAFRDRVSRLGDYQRGYTPPAAPVAQSEAKTIRLEIRGDEGRQMDYLDLGIDRARLEKFAQGLTSGKKLDVRTWTGRGALFSGSEFARLRGELFNRGFARWISERDPRGGAILTAKGQAVFRGLAVLPSPETIESPKITQ